MSRIRPGRLLVLGFEGTGVPEELASFAEQFGLGGVILFRRNCPDAATVRDLVARTRRRLAEADPESRPLFFVDQEGGRVERIPDEVPSLPPAFELGQRGEDAVEQALRAQAAALARVGVDVNLAPVCDVLQEGESGDIGNRSFGSEPGRVGTLAAAYVRGSLQGGVCPCAKHFPGLGSARLNSHLQLPVVEKTREAWEEGDLSPFLATLEAGVPLVMAAHVVYPFLSPLPASLSPEWLKRVLKTQMNYEGVVISDDMEMGAMLRFGRPEDVALLAVRAGCDLLIFSRMLRSDADPVRIAETLGEGLTEEEISSSGSRMERLYQVLDAPRP